MENTSKSQTSLSIRYHSAPNIALIKYWGKYHQDQILPINDSLGLTLNTNDLSTVTTCSFGKEIAQDEFFLNGQGVEVGKRMRTVLGKVREAARKSGRFEGMGQEEWQKYHFRIQSENSFPTASGMASSASGFSCLATALNGLFGGILSEKEVSRLARWGSGSAARAVHGGLVKWKGVDECYLSAKQVEADQLEQLSKLCITNTVKPGSELSYMRVIILLTENKEKEVSSTLGMKLSKETSEFITLRNGIASRRIDQLEKLLKRIDAARHSSNKEQQYSLFSEVAEIIIRDSNQFHAICLDTYPPIFYLNDFSRSIISIVDNIINKESKKCKVAYSFDAGAHAFLFLHESMLQQTLHYFNSLFNLPQQAFNAKASNILKEPFESGQSFSKYKGKMIAPTQLWVTDVGRGAEPISQ